MRKNRAKKKSPDIPHLTAAEIWNEGEYRNRLNNLKGWLDRADQLVNIAKYLEPRIITCWDDARSSLLFPESSNQQEISIPPNNSYYPIWQDVYFMLIAYALENYFKAAILHNTPTQEKETTLGRLPVCINCHNLVELAKNSGFELDKSKRDNVILDMLRKHAEWRGRYTIPVRSKDLMPIQSIDGESYFAAQLVSNHIIIVNDLVARVQLFIGQSGINNLF